MTRIPLVRPIILRPHFINSARAGARTHICLPAWFKPKGRTAVGAEARAKAEADDAMRLPTPWGKLSPGDRLWVQEDVAELVDRRRVNSRVFFKLELPGGHVPIPGGRRGDRYTTAFYDAHRMPREHSRYTLEVVGVRAFKAQDISWDEIRAEGGAVDARQGKAAWWERAYGITMPWASNPDVFGLSFTFTGANIDGTVWVPDAPSVHSGPSATAVLLGNAEAEVDAEQAGKAPQE